MKSRTQSFNATEISAGAYPDRTGTAFVDTWLTYTGAFLFAVALLILVHEAGHYLAYRIRGYETVSIRINPFMGATSTKLEVRDRDFAWIILGGTVFNLSLAVLAALLQRFTRGMFRMLLKTYAATAFMVEGLVILTGLFFQEVVTDFAWLETLDWPRAAIAGLGVMFVCIAGLLSYDLWGFLGFHKDSPRRQLTLMILPNIIYGLLGTVLSLSLLPNDAGFFRRFIGLYATFQIVFLAVLVGLAPPGLARLHRDGLQGTSHFTRRDGVYALLLGCTAWVCSFLFLN